MRAKKFCRASWALHLSIHLDLGKRRAPDGFSGDERLSLRSSDEAHERQYYARVVLQTRECGNAMSFNCRQRNIS